MPQITHFNGSLVEPSFIKKSSHQTWQWTVCYIVVFAVDFQASSCFPEGKAAPKKRPGLELLQGLWLVTFDCAMLHHRTSAIERYQSCTAAMLQFAAFEGHMPQFKKGHSSERPDEPASLGGFWFPQD